VLSMPGAAGGLLPGRQLIFLCNYSEDGIG
jgi:hypothetical protein